MKRTVVTLLFVSAFVAVSQSLPNPGQLEKSSDDVTTESLSSDHLEDADPDKEIQFNPFAYTPLATFIQSMQAMMRKMQLHMGEVLRGMPPQEIDWAKLGNTTSHTKVVNGHSITVNETSYSNKEMPSEAVVHIRVVDNTKTENTERDSTTQSHIHTDSENSYTIPSEETQTRDISENYIYRISEENPRVERQPSRETENDYSDNVGDVDNSVEWFGPIQPIDLSGDTRVNSLMSENVKKGGLIMIDPDAELIDVVDGEVRKTYYPYQSKDEYQHLEDF